MSEVSQPSLFTNHEPSRTTHPPPLPHFNTDYHKSHWHYSKLALRSIGVWGKRRSFKNQLVSIVKRLSQNHVMELWLTPEYFYYNTEMIIIALKNNRKTIEMVRI